MYAVFKQSLATAFAFVSVKNSGETIAVLVGVRFADELVTRYVVFSSHSFPLALFRFDEHSQVQQHLLMLGTLQPQQS